MNILGLFHVHINFQITLIICIKKPVGLLIGIAFNLQLTLGKTNNSESSNSRTSVPFIDLNFLNFFQQYGIILGYFIHLLVNLSLSILFLQILL